MSNETEQRFLLREIENLKQRLERLEIQEQGRFVITPSTVTDNAIARFDGTDGKKIQNSGVKIDDSDNIELPSSASLKLKSYNVGEWQSWTPTLTGWSGAPTVVARYTIIGKICFFWIFVSGTSNSSDAYLTLPVTASNITNGAWGGANLRADNNGTTLTAASRWIIPADNPTIIRFNTNMSSGAWDTSGIKRIQVIGFYEMA